MRNVMFALLLCLSSLCFAQTYKYIGVEDGLSNRCVYNILKDPKGYMWFLTQEGIDRYDGTRFKHYDLSINNRKITPFSGMNALLMDSGKNLWDIDKEGNIFRYNINTDSYQLVFQLGKKEPVTFSYIDQLNNIWLCTPRNQYLYNIASQKLIHLINTNKQLINDIAQTEKNIYYFGTDKGVYAARLQHNTLLRVPQKELDSLSFQVDKLYYHKDNGKLFVASFEKGICAYDTRKQQLHNIQSNFSDINFLMTRYNEKEILVATGGMGVYKLNADNYQLSPYITTDNNRLNAMNGNVINALYVDNGQRIWLSNYPIGITVLYNRLPQYTLYKHSFQNNNSLANNQVNAVTEDGKGDLWFATHGGISLYYTKTGRWTQLLPDAMPSSGDVKNNAFISLCEVAPGIIWAGGYRSGIYQINKLSKRSEYIKPANFAGCQLKPDKYIFPIVKDQNGKIWTGGFYNLLRFDLQRKSARVYPGISGVKAILEKDARQMWIGCLNGLYKLDKESGKFWKIKLPQGSALIHSLHQEKGLLYIGTCGQGMLVYNEKSNSFDSYNKENSTLLSNNIYSILSNGKGLLFLSTENSIVRFTTDRKKIQNWTKEEGLMVDHFNASSGCYLRNGSFVFGSTGGAVEFNERTVLPQKYSSKLVFSDFQLFYKSVPSGSPDSPLKQNIDETKELELNYDQNIFSIQLASINYDYPSKILYSWKLEGFYDEWNKAGRDNVIRYTNLNPGKYKLRVRAISEETLKVLEERSIDIVINPPFWGSIWAIMLYIAVLGLIIWDFLRHYNMNKEQKVSNDKIHFFINTAHDIRTPLSLIKAPLDELTEKENLSPEGKSNLDTAIRNTNSLLRLITNLINFEKAEAYSNSMHVGEYELFTFIEEIMKTFQSYTDSRHINLTYDSNFRFLNVWFDKDKMESILKNLLSNAIKYTPDGGDIKVTAFSYTDYWGFEITDSGIGIPENEQKKLFKLFVRGSNAINSKITGSGIGLLLVRKLVKLHSGSISLKSKIDCGSSFRISFPQGNRHFKSHELEWTHKETEKIEHLFEEYKTRAAEVLPPSVRPDQKGQAPCILIVEDNDDMRTYLQRSLFDRYYILLASDGQEGWEIVQNIKPDLVISDIMMPNMNGDELCEKIKSDINTSHIPVILLTALDDKSNIIKGLKTGADDYITKPFDIAILKATIVTILSNRSVLKDRFAQLDIKNNDECINYASELDREFMHKVKEIVEKNLQDSNFTVDTLCSALNMSRSSFYNKIKVLTDQAPADFIRALRLTRAAELLKSKRYNITEVADLTGFNDAKYFREVFKKHYKMSPSRYMNESD